MHVFLHNVKSFHHLISDNEKNNNIDILPPPQQKIDLHLWDEKALCQKIPSW